MGNFKYFAPEIIKEEEYDNKADIYSLGCILYELCTLNEYYTDKYFSDKELKINIEKYNKKWQDMLYLLVREHPNNRPDIEEICKNFNNEILLTIKIENEDINKEIYFLNNTKEHNNINEINELNTIIYINNIEYQFQKYFIPENERIYNIKLIFYIYINNMNYMFYNCVKLKNFNFSLNDLNNVINKKSMFNYLRKEYNYDGKLIYEGEGDYLTNKRNGICKEYDNFGELIFEGEYLNGEKHGKCRAYRYGRLQFEGEYLNGKKHGKSKLYYDKGELVFEGNYLNDKKNGIFKKYYKGILVFEGEYLNGKKHGRYKEYDMDIKLVFEGEYKNGIRWNGKGKEYSIQCLVNDDEFAKENDVLALFSPAPYRYLDFEGEYLNGKRNGKCKEYYNGHLYEGRYLDGKKHGKWKEYDYHGNLIIEDEYLNGEIINSINQFQK